MIQHKGRDLTEMELRVLRCICNGDMDKEIAIKLDVTICTVKSHAIRIRDKLHYEGHQGNRVRFVLMVLRNKELVELMRQSKAKEGQ
jgi:DNA-binding NarL/FixJ family response regulator